MSGVLGRVNFCVNFCSSWRGMCRTQRLLYTTSRRCQGWERESLPGRRGFCSWVSVADRAGGWHWSQARESGWDNSGPKAEGAVAGEVAAFTYGVLLGISKVSNTVTFLAPSVSNIVSVTVCFFYPIPVSTKEFLSQPAIFIFCASNPLLYPTTRERGSVVWSLRGSTKLGSAIPQQRHLLQKIWLMPFLKQDPSV